MQRLVWIFVLFGCAQKPIVHNKEVLVNNDYQTLFNQTLKNIATCWKIPFDIQFKSEVSEYNVSTAIQSLINGYYTPGHNTEHESIYAKEYKSIKEAEVFVRRSGRKVLSINLQAIAANKTKVIVLGKSPFRDEKASTDKIFKIVTQNTACSVKE